MDRPLRPVQGLVLVLALAACTSAPPANPVVPPPSLPAPNSVNSKPDNGTTPLAAQPSNSAAVPSTPLAVEPMPSPKNDQALAMNPPPAAIPSTGPATAPVPESTRAYLGIVPDRSAKASTVGVLVQGTQPGSPAAIADLRAGDLIVEIDGRPIANLDQLGLVLDHAKIGQSLALVILRGDTRMQLTARLAHPPGPGH